MKSKNGFRLFGFWDGMPYGEATDKFEDFKHFKNTIDKKKVIQHIETLDDWLSSEPSKDMFTGEHFNSGFYEDGDFRFPVDFLRYYKTQDIGIPYEYEDYLKDTLK